MWPFQRFHQFLNSIGSLGQVKKREEKQKNKTMHFQEQQNFENRIACGICLDPRLRMVTGNCQHRFCVQCIYDGSGKRKSGLERCPSCQLDSAFPSEKPVIPEDLIEIQRALGVRECDRCGEEMWLRELDDHQRVCVESLSKKKTSSTPSKSHSSPSITSSRSRSSPSSTANRSRSSPSSTASRSRSSPESSPRERDGGRHKTPSKHALPSEVQRLLDDLEPESGVRTRSHRGPRCLQELDFNGKAKRRHRSPPSKVKSPSSQGTTENRRPQQLHPYRKK